MLGIMGPISAKTLGLVWLGTISIGHPTLQVVVVRILRHPSVQECPREIIHSVLLVFNRLGDHLGIEMVVKAVIKM